MDTFDTIYTINTIDKIDAIDRIDMIDTIYRIYIVLINTNTIDKIYPIDWYCRPHQPNYTSVVSFFYLTDWLS